MDAAIEHIEQRHRQGARAPATQGAVERLPASSGCGLGDSQGSGDQGVGAQAFLVGGPIQRQQHLVELLLRAGVLADQARSNDPVDVVHRLLYPLPPVALGAPVAQLPGLVRASRRPRGRRGPATHSVGEYDIHLDRRIPPAIEDFPADHFFNFHRSYLMRCKMI